MKRPISTEPIFHVFRYLKAILAVSVIMLFFVKVVVAQAPTLVGSTGNTSGGSNTTSLTLTLPGGMGVEDLIVASVSWRANVTITPADDGWILIDRTNQGGDVTQAVYYRVYRSGDPSTYQFNSSGSQRNTGSLVVYRNANPASVELINSANNGTSSGTSATALSIDTQTNNSVILAFYSIRSNNAATAPAGMTQLQNVDTSGGGANGNMRMLAADESRITAGATGNRLASIPSNRPWVAHMVSVAPRNSGNTIYSYQSGNWNGTNIWTLDPSGTTLTGAISPSIFDSLVVLNGRVITLTANLNTDGYRINIESGGTLDLVNFTTGRLTTLNGQGVLRTRGIVAGSPNTAYFPETFFNYIIRNTGGTVVYYQQGNVNLPEDISSYRNLTLRNQTASNIIFVQAADLQIFNNLNLQHTSTGTLILETGNNTTPRQMSIGSNVTISSQSTWRVNTANVNHTISIGGDLVNNGSFLMSRMASPNYLSDSNEGRAEVTFTGAQSNKIDAFGSTIFYRLVVDKGIDQTHILTVNSTNPANFRLFGRNNQNIAVGDNPDSDKALFIKNGTLRLRDNIEIESLSEGGTDYIINKNASLWVDGATVFGTLTAGSPGGSTATGNTGLTIIGKLRVTAGLINTRDSAGIVYRNDGEVVMEGGVLRTSTLRASGAVGTHRAAFFISGGTIISDGEGETGGAGRFSLPFADNSITMSGGTVIVTQPPGVGGTTIDFQMDNINYNITGGSWQFISTNGTTNFTVNSVAPFFNVTTIKTGGGSADVRLNAPITILNNLTVESGVFQATSNHPVTVGGNFSINSGATYNPNSNTTTFNGSGKQILTLNGAIASGGLFNVSVNKPSDTLRVAGSAGSLIIRNDLVFSNGVIDDGGKTLEINGNLTMSGRHVGSGRILLNPNGNRTISGNGNGRFANLELTASVANVVFNATANLQLTGTLTFTGTGTQERILNIAGNRFTFSGGAAATGANQHRYIRTNGNVSAAGVTKIFNNELTFNYPIGVGTRFTPAIFSLDVNPTAFGSVNIKPVSATHPAITDNNYALNYYWKVEQSDFILGSSKVSFTFEYSNSDLGGSVIPADLVPARYDVSTNTWAVATSASVNQANRIISFDGVLYQNTISGDYTTADNSVVNPFGSLTLYFSCANSNWFTLTTWCLDGHNGSNTVSSIPGANTIAIVGNGNTVTMNNNNALSAILRILENSTLDIGTTNGHNLGIVDGPTFGTLRSGASYFPSGDFGDFLNNGTVVYYRIGSNYTLPVSSADINPLNSYYNLQTEVNTGGAGSFIALPNLALQVLNDMTVSGTDADRQTRVSDAGASSLTVNGNLTINSGSLRFRFNGTNNRDVTIHGNITISSGAELGFYDNNANRIHFLNLYGDLVNNGTLNLNNNTLRTVELVFRGTTDAIFSGTGNNTFTRLEVDKGTSMVPRLNLSNSGTITMPSGALLLTNGTLEITRTGILTLTNTAVNFVIPSSTALVVNNSGADIRIGFTNSNNADLILRGKLELIDGTIRIGDIANNTNNDIEYASAGTPELIISGGLLDVNGQIRRNTLNVSGSLVYRQTGSSEVRIRGRNANSSRGMLEVTNNGSEFELSDDALIHIYRGGSISYADFYVRPQSANATGGTVLFKPTGAGNQNYLLDLTTNLWNITVENDGTSIANLTQQINNIQISNNLLLNNASVYNANGLNMFIGRRFTRVGTAVFNPGTNNVTFDGANSQISGTFTGSNSFHNLLVAPSKNLELLSSSNIRVNNNLTINNAAQLNDGGNLIDVRADIINNGTHISLANSSTSGLDINGTGTQSIGGNGVFGNINIKNASGATLTGNITIINRLTLTGGSLIMTDRSLTFDTAAEVTNYSNTRYLRTNGVLSDGGIRKNYPGTASSFEFPIGVFGKYTPVTINVTSTTAPGSVNIKPINVKHPSHRDTGTNLLQYYWNVNSTGFANLEVTHIYNYLQADASGTESTYRGGRYLFPNWTPIGGIPGSVNTTTNTITLAGVDFISGDYTAGEETEFTGVDTYYSRNGLTYPINWTDPASWSVDPVLQHDGAASTTFPVGAPAIIETGHTVRTNGVDFLLAESVELKGTAILDLEDTFGHNFGFVSGTGTIRIRATSGNQFVFPGGNYDDFVTRGTGGTVIFYDDTDGILPTQTQYNDVIMTGSSDRTQANVNWIINGNLLFEGGTVDNTSFDRNLSLRGDWINEASADVYIPGDGKVILIGSDPQSITGDFATTFATLELNGPGLKSLNQPVTITKGMNFVRGNLVLNDATMTWRAGASVGGTPADTSMIVINGDGVLRRQIDQVSTLLFPIGDTTGVATYSPATLAFTSGNFGSGAHAEIGVVNAPAPFCAGGNYILRYWTVEMNAITSFAGTGSFVYGQSDVVGDEGEIRTLSRNISDTDCDVGPFANTSSNTLSFALGGSTGFVITGGDKGSILPPDVQPTDLTFITVTSTSIELGWTNGNGDGRLVLVREGAAVDDVPVLNEFYSADANYAGSPAEIGTGNFVVYAGTDDTFTLSGLDPKTRYHFSLFEFNEDGSFISYLTTSPLVGDTLTMARFEITFTGDRGWRMISLPLEDTRYEDVFADASTTGLYTQGFPGSTNPGDSPNLLWYLESHPGTDNQRWRQPGDIDNTVVPGRGYMYYVFGDTTPDDSRYAVDFPINLVAEGYEPALIGDFDFTLSYTVAADSGWNMLGNPYDDAIDWDDPSWTRTNVADAIYIWDPNASGGPKYRVWSNSVGDDMDGIIARGQAFWVKATGDNPVLRVNRDAIVSSGLFYGKQLPDGSGVSAAATAGGSGSAGSTGGAASSATGSGSASASGTGSGSAGSTGGAAASATGSGSASAAASASTTPARANATASSNREAVPSIEIRVNREELHQSTWVMFHEDASRGLDPIDAWYLQPLVDTYVSVYTKIDNTNFAINAQPRRFNTSLEIPVHIGGFRNGVSMSGSYTLEMGQMRNIPESWAIEMVDEHTGQRVMWKNAFDPVLHRIDPAAYALSQNNLAARAPAHHTDNEGNRVLSGDGADSHGAAFFGADAELPENMASPNRGGLESIKVADSLADNALPFLLDYGQVVRIQQPRPGEQIRMKAISGTSRSRFVLKIHPNGEFPELPQEISLGQNYPNPFNPVTTIPFQLPLEEIVRIDVFDVLGRRVTTLANGTYPAGSHSVQFSGRNLASGVYFIRMVAGDKVLTQKMMLIK